MSEPSLPKAALLCIDDDQAVLECEKAFLETFGYTVVTASSAPQMNLLCSIDEGCSPWDLSHGLWSD
jgi:CheY-like chemotaxis protein